MKSKLNKSSKKIFHLS